MRITPINKRKKQFLLLLLSCFCYFQAEAQIDRIDNNQPIKIGATIQLNVHFDIKGDSHFSASAAFGLAYSFRGYNRDAKRFNTVSEGRFAGVPFWQVALNLYGSGLGDNLLPSEKQIQIDVINSFGISAEIASLAKIEELYEVVPFNSMTASAIYHNNAWANISLGTNFVANNHKRNQQVGFINVGIWEMLQVSFYNDGPFFSDIGFGDSYDRWWTGGGMLLLKIPSNRKWTKWADPQSEKLNRSHRIYALFDRFTADQQDAYTLSNNLYLANVPSKNVAKNFYNQGQFVIGMRHSRGLGVKYVWINYPKLEIQDKIHDAMGVAHHFTLGIKLNAIGVQFDRFLYQAPLEIQ